LKLTAVSKLNKGKQINMPKVTLTFPDEASIPSELKAFKTADNKVEVWAGDKVAEETNPSLVANRDTIKAEKDTLKLKYDALVSTSSADDVKTAKRIADLEAKATNPIPEADQKLLDAVKKANKDATPESVTEAITKFPTVNQKLTEIETKAANGEFFKATGFKSEKAFQKAIADKEANPKLVKHYTETKTENGKEVTNAYADIKKDDGTTEKIAFKDYVEKHADWAIYKPALMEAQTSQTWISADTSGNQHQPTNGQPNALLGNAIAGAQKVIDAKKEAVKTASN
jgi:hypothetical protein